jgi:glucan biosynthesis protein C
MPLAPPTERLYFLDWLRIVALALLVPYHVGMYYVTWGWHVKSPWAGSALEPWMRLSAPWRMSLLFLVAGAATAFMLRSEGPSGAWLRQRAKRLLLPLLAGMLVIVPPQSYWQVVQQSGYGGDYLDFLRLYFGGHAGFRDADGHRLLLPTWNHLWFLPYLFCYTLVLWGLLRRWPQALETLARGAGRVLQGPGLLALPVLALALVRWTLGPHFSITHALVDDVFAHAQYGPLFVLGAALAVQGRLWPAMERQRWPALCIALAAWALLLATDGVDVLAVRRLAYATQQWCAIVAAVGFAHRHLNVDSAARRWLTEAVFPVYVLHQTLIVLGAMALAPLALRPALEGPVLVGGTLALGLLGFMAARPWPVLRPWLGLGPLRRASAPGPGTITRPTATPSPRT